MDSRFLSNLLIRKVQPHKVDTKNPNTQRLMMALEEGIR